MTTYISCIFSILVVALGWKNGYLMEDLFLQAVISFGFIFILINLSVMLYDKFDIWVSLTDATKNEELQYGELRLVNNEDLNSKTLNERDSFQFIGQVEPSLASGLPNDNTRMEIKQKMGLN